MISFSKRLAATHGRASSVFSVALAACLAGASLSADRITLVSGDPIEDCTIVTETLKEVSYKIGSSKRSATVASEQVLSIEYGRVPSLVGEGDDALAKDDSNDAHDAYDFYLSKHLNDRPERRYLWAPAYAANKLIEINKLWGDVEGIKKSADRLIANFSDSRYLPGAYMAKAACQAEAGDTGGAVKTLEQLEKLIIAKDLSKRWSLECRLSKVLFDTALAGDKRRDKLGGVENDAGGEFPTVRNRATVAIGESFLAQAGPQGDGRSSALAKARDSFEDVIADPSADGETLAGAYTGLGDCQFQAAAASKQPKDYRESLMTFMRVVVLYRDEVRYAPKAMFYAGRCFNLLGAEGDNDRAKKLYRRVIRSYPGTLWEEQARDFLK